MKYKIGDTVVIRRPTREEVKIWAKTLVRGGAVINYHSYIKIFNYENSYKIDGISSAKKSVGIKGHWFPIQCVYFPESIFDE